MDIEELKVGIREEVCMKEDYRTRPAIQSLQQTKPSDILQEKHIHKCQISEYF